LAAAQTPPNDFLLKHLLSAVYWFDESLQQHLAAAGFPTMNRTKSFIMMNISDGIERPIQIAANLGLTRQAVHLALKELEQEGLISIADDPHDRRAKRVFFSHEDQRETMRKAAYEALKQIEDELAERVGRDKFAVFKEVLTCDWGALVGPQGTSVG